MSVVGRPGLDHGLETALDTFYAAVEEVKMLRLAQGRTLDERGAALARRKIKAPVSGSFTKPKPARPVDAGSFRRAAIIAVFATLIICLPGASIEEHATKAGSQSGQLGFGVQSRATVPAAERWEPFVDWRAAAEQQGSGAPEQDGAVSANASPSPIDDAAINLLLASLARQQSTEQTAEARWPVDDSTAGVGYFPLTNEASFQILPGAGRRGGGDVERSADSEEAGDPPAPLPLGGSSTDANSSSSAAFVRDARRESLPTNALGSAGTWQEAGGTGRASDRRAAWDLTEPESRRADLDSKMTSRPADAETLPTAAGMEVSDLPDLSGADHLKSVRADLKGASRAGGRVEELQSASSPTPVARPIRGQANEQVHAAPSSEVPRRPSTGAPTPGAASRSQQRSSVAATMRLPLRHQLVVRAGILLNMGDFAGARLLLHKSVELGDARAALLLAETYDIRILSSRYPYAVVSGNQSRAQQFYALALAAGIPDAAERILGRQIK